MNDALLEAHVTLRLRAMSHHEAFAGDLPRATAFLREKLRPLHAEGTVRAAVEGGSLFGVLAWKHDPEPWCGEPVSAVALDYDPRWSGADAWLAEVLDDELPRMEADLDLLLDARHDAARHALRARGVGVDSIVLLGRPEVALARLIETGTSNEPAVQLVPLEEEHIDPLMALERETFTREPQFCWFATNEQALARMRDGLFHALSAADPMLSVVIADGRPRGLVQASLRDDALWGLTAGMSLLLAPELRGRGFARPIYRALLERMVEHGARTFKGGTNQPGVIRLGALMGRKLHAFVMRRGAPFPESHFRPYL